MRVVCVRHSKRIEVPARDRLDDEPVLASCHLGHHGEHGPIDLLVETEYNKEMFEMYWGQAI